MSTNPQDKRTLYHCEKQYRRLLALYPASFRREYESLMIQLFRDQCREARQAGRVSWMEFWWWICRDTLVGACRQRFYAIERKLKVPMKFLKAVLCLVASVVFGLIAVGGAIAMAPGDKPLSFVALAFIALSVSWVPLLCWLLIFLPLFFIKAMLSRWPWYVAGACGAVAGVVVLALSFALLTEEHHELLMFWVITACSVGLQFALGSFISRSPRAAVESAEHPTLTAT